VDININISEERYGELSGGALCLVEEIFAGLDKEPSMRDMHDLIFPFMQDGNGVYLTEEQARETLKRIKQKDFTENVFKPFMSAYKDHLVPKESGNSSTPSPKTEAEAQPGSTT